MTNFNPNKGYKFNQSGVIPFRLKRGKVEIMLITTRRKQRWIVPKGIIEQDMTAIESASAEAYEEAGIKGRIHPKLLGKYKNRKWGGICTVQIYLLKVEKVLDKWPEADFRRRQWVLLGKAEKLVKDKMLQKIIRQLPLSIKRCHKILV